MTTIHPRDSFELQLLQSARQNFEIYKGTAIASVGVGPWVIRIVRII